MRGRREASPRTLGSREWVCQVSRPVVPTTPTGRRPRTLVLLLVPLGAVLLCLAVGLVAWRLLDDGRIRQWEELAALPDAGLHYSGSVQVSAAGRDYEVGILARVNAFYSQTLGVDAGMDEVRDFYARELPQRGWVQTCEGGPCGSPPGNVWRKGQLLLKFYHKQPEVSTDYRTLYSLHILASPLPPTATATR